MARQDRSDTPVDLLWIHQPVPCAPCFADAPNELSVWTACGRGCLSPSARIPGFVPGLGGHPLPRPPPAPPPRHHRCPGRRAWSARVHAALVPEIARTGVLGSTGLLAALRSSVSTARRLWAGRGTSTQR